MSLHRVDHMVTDAQGRPVRRVTRYVERRGGATVPVALPAAAAPPAGPPDAAGAALAVPTDTGAPAPPAASGDAPAVDLEDTETVRGLRAALAEAQAKLGQHERELGALQGRLDEALRRPVVKAPPGADPAALEALRDALATLGGRVASIEDCLGDLEQAAAAAAGEEPAP